MQLLMKVNRLLGEHGFQTEVILFGSRARGDFKPDSDWDLLILIDAETLNAHQKSEILNLIYHLELDCGEVIAPLIHTYSEWSRLSGTPLYQIIQKEGVRA